jgi:hypothetical protein
MKWTDRSPEERRAILTAPFPIVHRHLNTRGHAPKPREDADPSDHRWSVDAETGLTVRKIFREWPFKKGG